MKKMKKISMWALLCLSLFIPARSARGEPVVLTLPDCLAMAEANHPSLAGADGQVAAQRGRLAQSAASQKPEVSGSASTSRGGSDGMENARYSAGVSASLRVFDANRSKYTVDSQRNTLLATEEERSKTLSDVRANVKSTYMTLLLDMDIAVQRLESVRAFESYLEQARAFYEAGTQPWYNVTKAEVDLGKAQLALVEAEAEIEMTKSTLFNAIGVDRPKDDFSVAPVDLDVSNIKLSGTETGLLSGALENRSDYRAADLRVTAGRSTVKAEARASSPSISVSGGMSGIGNDLFDLTSEWNTGLGMSIPIFDGGAAKAGLDAARGQLAVLEASREKLRQDIALETRKALTDIARALERIRISELTLVSAEENRKIAMGRYETGAGGPFEVTDALLSFTEAQLENRKAKYDMQLALVALEKATGSVNTGFAGKTLP